MLRKLFGHKIMICSRISTMIPLTAGRGRGGEGKGRENVLKEKTSDYVMNIPLHSLIAAGLLF